jgi:subtilisin family serine protease
MSFPRDLNLILEHLNEVVMIGDNGNDGIEYTYASFTGSSMAVPHVAAAAAILWSHFGECTNHQIRYALVMTAQIPGHGDCDDMYAYGIVKVKGGYDWLEKNPCREWDVPSIS